MSDFSPERPGRWRTWVSNILLLLGIPCVLIGLLIAIESGTIIGIIIGAALIMKSRLLRPDPDEVILRRPLPDRPDQYDTAYIAQAPGSDEDRRA